MSRSRILPLILASLTAGLMFLLLAAVVAGAAGPATICTVPGSHATIQAAVADLTCTVIDIATGTFFENVAVNRVVTLEGVDALSTTVDGGGAGPVFHIQPGGAVTLTKVKITNGAAVSGGGILNEGRLTIAHAAIINNAASESGGGVLNLGTLQVSNTTLTGNVAISLGGGIANWSSIALLTVTGSMISGNNASFGGGLYNLTGTVTIINSTISGNSVISDGGGIYNENGTVTLTSSTLSGNSASVKGGGIKNQSNGTASMGHTILGNNTAPMSPDCGGTVYSQDYNLVEITSACFITGTVAHNIYGQDPLLGPLQDNGGSTWTQALLTGSRAIDAGNNATCPAADQRGATRPRDGNGDGQVICDIGAFELQDTYIQGLNAVNNGPTALGQPTTFTATITAGSNVFYNWAFGDGASASGPIVSHTYTDPGLYSATVTATNLESSATVTTTVLVEESIAGLNAVNSSPTILGQSTTFTATVTAGANVIYTWDFGDGSSGSGAVVSHTYAAVGPYLATVTAENSVSNAMATTTVAVDVVIAGLAAANDSPTALGQPTTFMATITSGSNVIYDWDFGDGTSGSGAVVAHTYAAGGLFTATVTAVNSVSSAEAETEVTVEVAISGLEAVNSSPTELGDTTTFTATITAGMNVTYLWDFGDGASGSGAVVNHIYGEAGLYTVVVTAANLVSSDTAETQVLVGLPGWPIYLPVVLTETVAAAAPAGAVPAFMSLLLGGLVIGGAVWRRRK